MMGWQWHQLDHVQIICTSLQTDNHANTQFFTSWMLFLMPTNSVKAKGNSVKTLKTLASKHARPNYFVCHIN